LFEAPDLQLLFDPDEQGAGDGYFLALGGLSARAAQELPTPAATGTTTANEPSKKTTMRTLNATATPTDGVAAAAITAALATAGPAGFNLYGDTPHNVFQELPTD
ncbi:hypothetical protein Agub_g13667, partial [Astrephomene gubernaculifera]